MHTYLKSIGFSTIKRQKDIELLIMDILENYDTREYVELEDHRVIAEFRKEYAYDSGICVYGEYDENNEFHVEHYQPYYEGSNKSFYEELSVEREAARDRYYGACDDIRLGITLIFHLNNPMDYLKLRKKNSDMNGLPVCLAGLASDGIILLPLRKTAQQQERELKLSKEKAALLRAARQGDEEAIDTLTMDDFDTYSMVSKRLAREDIYTIVESCFMPRGMESDQYSLTGEITEVESTINQLTNEKMYELGVVSNGITLDVLINEKDLLGVPEIGRRFKGKIWLQGTLKNM